MIAAKFISNQRGGTVCVVRGYWNACQRSNSTYFVNDVIMPLPSQQNFRFLTTSRTIPKESSTMKKADVCGVSSHTNSGVGSLSFLDELSRRGRTNVWHQEESHANISQEISLKDAVFASKSDAIDKVMIFIRHGEALHNNFERDYNEMVQSGSAWLDPDCPRDPLLTKRGYGKALDIARALDVVADLKPELVLTSPLRRATQTAVLSLNRYHPSRSIREVKWICHPLIAEESGISYSDIISSPDDLEREFGCHIDYSLHRVTYRPVDENNIQLKTASKETKAELERRAIDFIEWVKGRDENVIVVVSHMSWLDALNRKALNLANETSPYDRGEIRAVAMNWL